MDPLTRSKRSEIIPDNHRPRAGEAIRDLAEEVFATEARLELASELTSLKHS